MARNAGVDAMVLAHIRAMKKKVPKRARGAAKKRKAKRKRARKARRRR